MTIKGQPLWIAVGTAALLSLILLAIGFGMAVVDYLHPSASPPKRADVPPAGNLSGGKKPLLVSLGDSLTRGTGDVSGKGYVGTVKEALQKVYGGGVTAVNLGINGQTSADLVKQIRQTEVREILARATWITITIGGNDLFRASGGPERIDRVAVDEGRASYRRNLSRILKEIRELNTRAPVFIYGLYNPFGDLPGQEQSSRLVMEWNQTIAEIARRFPRVVVVPTFDIFQLHPSRYLYSDHFHPNQAGYRQMAERLLQAMGVQGREVMDDVRP